MRAWILRVPVLAALPGAVAGCAHLSHEPTTDLVVMGRAETLTYEALDEFGMNGRMTARLTITRVIEGRPPSPVLTISYIAHGDYASDRDIRLHLRRSSHDNWIVCGNDVGRGYICR